MSKPILKAFLKKRSIDKSPYVLSTNFQKRWFVLDDKHLTYYDGKSSKMGEEKGKVELKKILAVEALDDLCMEDKRDVFQVIHICPTRYDPVILYVVTSSKQEQEKWINGIRREAIKNEAPFIKNYHPGIWVDGAFTCCHAQGKIARGCKLVHGTSEEGPSHEHAGDDQGAHASSRSSSTRSRSQRETEARTAPSRPQPRIPTNAEESTRARHIGHNSPRSSQKRQLTKKSSTQSSSYGHSQFYKIFVAVYDYRPTSESDDIALVKGERYEVLDDSDEHWCNIKSIRNGYSGFAPRNYLEEDTDVESYEWYCASKEECELLLVEDGRPGCFLVRDSREKGTFTLCLYDGASIKNFRIEKTTTGNVYIRKEKEFTSVPNLIEYYHQHEVGSTGLRLESIPM
ncbi:tyrosine-protein kinase ITK/TSK-like [Saccostrea cucullata]|uniref:tyrosine-protein kinase ITK/TSK-like n=1 Tax=Saccostrea cuccullata TaxID=36930 RepID=UPI002ED5D422